MGKKLFVLACLMQKFDAGQHAFNIISGYRVTDAEHDAKGSFVEHSLATKPGFGIAQLLCMEIPPEAVRQALSEGEQK